MWRFKRAAYNDFASGHIFSFFFFCSVRWPVRPTRFVLTSSPCATPIFFLSLLLSFLPQILAAPLRHKPMGVKAADGCNGLKTSR